MLDTRWDQYEAEVLGPEDLPQKKSHKKVKLISDLPPPQMQLRIPEINRSPKEQTISDSQDYEISEGGAPTPEKPIP